MEISRGEVTKTVYTLIKEEKLPEAVEILEQLLELQPSSRSALSLLAYCNFQLQNFDTAATFYDRLTNLYPDIAEYQFYLSQSLYNVSNYEGALEASYLRGEPDLVLQGKVLKLQAAIQYCQDEVVDAKALVEKCDKLDPDTEVFKGCLSYKEGNYVDASRHFESAANMVGMEPLLWYNRAVSCYQRGDFPSAAHYTGEIIEYGAIHFSELKMGHKSQSEDLQQSVGNSRTLHKSALVETLNLKAALEMELKKNKAARDTLRDLPPRSEHEIDPISLHNIAILNIQEPVEGLRKLRYLLEQNMFPPETFTNLLILYWRYEHFDLMADLMAVYEEYKMKHLSHDMRRFFESLIKREVAPEEAVKEMEEQCIELGKVLLEKVKKVANIKLYGNEDEIRTVCNEFDDLLDGTYMPMLLTLGKIFWDKEDMNKVEEILRFGAEFLDDRDSWLINCAHVVYRRGKDYAEAAGLYELVVRKYQQDLLQVSAASLANLVVCYVSLLRNEEAEKMIQKIQEQELLLLESHKGIKVYHSCIMSLVIGTLYCVKNNYQFGINRIYQALLDFDTKLNPDSWFYVKVCILSLVERIIKNSICVSQETLKETLTLLLRCEEYGVGITTVIEETSSKPQIEEDDMPIVPINYGTKTIAYESRYLQYILKKLQEVVLI